MSALTQKTTWITLFSIAMGFMETAVVIYLRKLYYPNGFQFPLVPVTPDIAFVEFFREAATIIMLVAVGIFNGKTVPQKFAYFIFSFAVWDLFYYVFLKLFLNWPESLFTWDILFLIPIPWVGPVLAPCIVSLTMIVLMLFIIHFSERGRKTTIHVKEWLLLISGSVVIIVSFIWDYIVYVTGTENPKQMWTLSSSQDLFIEIASYVPTHYNWSLFWFGEIFIVFGIILFVRRIKHA